jgi:hypothetical protein
MRSSSQPSRASLAYRTAIGVAVLTAFATLWTTIVRDDGNGIGFLMLIMAVAVGWFSAAFRPEGMARTMVGIAVMQGLLGLLIATAPSTEAAPRGPTNALAFSGIFALLWLLAGAFFRSAAREGSRADKG